MHRLQPSTEVELRAAMSCAARRSGEARFVHRLHAVLLVSLGRSCYEVARWFGESPRTVERWVHAYEQRGDGGLHELQRAGRPARLTPQQASQLALDLARGPRACGFAQSSWSGKLVLRHLQSRYSVRLSLRHCQRLLRRAQH
jgi:transposase